MKRIGIFALALALTPSIALAQQNPPGPGPDAMSHPGFAAMRQVHEQMAQLRKQARLQMLASLSPAHRAMLANVVGQLAISSNPDPRAAAQLIDRALSPGEAQSVLNVEAQARTQMRSMMQAARSQFEASLTPDQRAQMEERESKRGQFAGQHRQPTADPGRSLLRAVTGFGGGHPGGRGNGGPPPQQ
jgi:Spy/CpxP family protein refolding chaperone